MIRVLLMIAAGGFVLSLACFSAAVAVGGQEALRRGAWGIAPWAASGWDWDHDWDHDRGRERGELGGSGGPTVTREIAWSGEDALEVDVRADVTYVQAPGPAKLTVTGPQQLIERLSVDGGRIRFRGRPSSSRITIAMTAPNVTRFNLSGNDRLTIENYDQNQLRLDVAGSSDVTAKGRARALSLEISGSGRADLGELQLEDADVDISGSGEARIAPRERADLDISGSGEITLLTRPRSLETDISGSGSIRQEAPASSAGETPPPKTT
jgi:hypothetical protein